MPTGGFITITLTYEGATGPQQISRRLATWGARIDDLSEPLQLIGEDLLGDFAVNMLSEGGLFARGRRWTRLARGTVRERVRQGYGSGPILWRTGALAESLAYQGAPGNVFRVSRDQLSVGTEVFYAGFHQAGTRRMPRRAVVGLARNRRASIIARLNAFVQAQAEAQGVLVVGGE